VAGTRIRDSSEDGNESKRGHEGPPREERALPLLTLVPSFGEEQELLKLALARILVLVDDLDDQERGLPLRILTERVQG
jgi:hypothetical protein